jgi:class I fructose-bisphosphate aldolase
VTNRLMGSLANGARIVILPVDHGLALGEVDGLEDPVQVALSFAQSSDIDGTLCSAPVARRLRDNGFPSSALVMVTLDSALQGMDGSIRQVPICSVKTAKAAGCDGVKVLMAWEEGLGSRAITLRVVADAVAAGQEEGLPVIVEPVASGAVQRLEAAEIERRELEGARIAIEVGADIIKCRIWDTPRFARFVKHCPVPVVALGGSLSGGSSSIRDSVKRGLDMGLSGVFVGRNVWQRPAEEALQMLSEICSFVHSGNTPAKP